MAKKKTTRKKNPNGRPRVLNDKKKSEIIKFVSLGGSRTIAAKYVGCSTTTIADEAARDEKFSDDLRQAEAKAYAGHLRTIAHASSKGDVKAAQWYLARKYPEEFGSTSKHNIVSANVELTKEEREKALNSILEERCGIVTDSG